MSFFYILVGKETSVVVKIVKCVFRLSVIQTSAKDSVVQEPPGVGVITASVILLLVFCKWWFLMVASDLRAGLRFWDIEYWA